MRHLQILALSIHRRCSREKILLRWTRRRCAKIENFQLIFSSETQWDRKIFTRSSGICQYACQSIFRAMLQIMTQSQCKQKSKIKKKQLFRLIFTNRVLLGSVVVKIDFGKRSHCIDLREDSEYVKISGGQAYIQLWAELTKKEQKRVFQQFHSGT